MDGKTLKEMFLDAVDKPEEDLLQLNPRVIYRHLDSAAIEFCRLTRCLTGVATITSIQGRSLYDLPPDFIDLYMKNAGRRLVAKYTDAAGETYWPVVTSYEKIFQANLTERQAVPERLAIVARFTGESMISGNANFTTPPSTSSETATLEDGTKALSLLVQVRDNVHNQTRNSDGLVIKVTPLDVVVSGGDDSPSGQLARLTCAMFGGSTHLFSDGDAYKIVPAATHQVQLDAPSLTAGETLSLPYIRMPTPVYSSHYAWELPEQSCRAICEKAAATYLTNKGVKRGIVDQLRVNFQKEIARTREEMAMRYLQGGHYLYRS